MAVIPNRLLEDAVAVCAEHSDDPRAMRVLVALKRAPKTPPMIEAPASLDETPKPAPKKRAARKRAAPSE